MTDYSYGRGTSDFTFEIVGDQQVMRAGTTVTFWDAESGGTQITGIKDSTGTAVTDNAVVSDSTAALPRFSAPVPSMWADAGLGRFLIQSNDLADLIADALGPDGGIVANLTVTNTVTAAQATLTNIDSVDIDVTDLSATNITVPDGGGITIDGEEVLTTSDLDGIGGGGGGSLDLNSTPALNFLDTTGTTYLRRSQLTSSLTRPVWWCGQAPPPLHSTAGGSDINGARLVDKWVMDPDLPLLTGATIPAAPDPNEPVTPDPNNVVLHAPTFTVNNTTGTVALSVLMDVATTMTFAYYQIAVRRAGAANPGDVGILQNVTVLGPGSKVTSGTTTVLPNGNYTAYGAYNITGSDNQSDWTDGPAVSFTVNRTTTSPTPGTTTTWSSGAFTEHVATKFTGFQTFVGRSGGFKNVTVFPDRTSTSSIAGTWYLGSAYIPAGFTGAIAVGMPMCPDSGSLSTDMTSAFTTLANAYKADGRTYYIRLGWEMNLGGWAWKVTDSNLAQFRSRWSQYYDIFKNIMGAKAQIGFNPNGGVDQSGITGGVMRAWVDGKVDWCGPDQYDCYPAFNSDSNVNSHLTGTGGLNFWANTARNKGVKLAFPEWGVSSGTQWAGNTGNDNPRYITEMRNFMLANHDIMLFDSYFYETASYLESDIWVSGSTSAGSNNPNAGTQYKTLFSV